MCREIVSFVERAWLTVPSIPFSSQLPAKTLGGLASDFLILQLADGPFLFLDSWFWDGQFRKCVPHCPLNERWLKTLNFHLEIRMLGAACLCKEISDSANWIRHAFPLKEKKKSGSFLSRTPQYICSVLPVHWTFMLHIGCCISF